MLPRQTALETTEALVTTENLCSPDRPYGSDCEAKKHFFRLTSEIVGD
jgi:hypothetical protein